MFSDNVTDNVAEGLVLFVFGRQTNYKVLQPSGEWLRIWYYLFLADEMHYKWLPLVPTLTLLGLENQLHMMTSILHNH